MASAGRESSTSLVSTVREISMPAPPQNTYLTDWAFLLQDARESITDLGDAELIKAERMHTYGALGELLVAAHVLPNKQINSANLSNMPELHHIMKLMMNAAEMRSPKGDAEVYEQLAPDSEVKSAAFQYMKYNKPTIKLGGTAQLEVVTSCVTSSVSKEAKARTSPKRWRRDSKTGS